MEFLLANHSSYPRIGDSHDYQLLRRTIAQRDKGKQTDEDLRSAEDRMTELALSEQADASLDLVTDGQIRWYDPLSHLAGKLSGVRINGLLRFFDTNFYFRQPIVQSKPERTKPLIVDEFLFAKAKSSRPVKPVLTGPLTLARLSITSNGFGSREQLVDAYAEALAQEVAALAQAGATQIQIDEPALLKYPEDAALVDRSLQALGANRGTAKLSLALYFGDPAPLYEKLLTLPVDVLALDFTYNPALVDVVAAHATDKTLALGLVDGRNTKLEDASTVAKSLEKITRTLLPERTILSPSCGLEYLPRDRAQLKLKHLATIKQTFLGKAA